MRRKLRFSPLARQDMQEIAAYLRQNFPAKGISTRQEIMRHCYQLAETPMVGIQGKEPDTREYVMPGLPYRVIFRNDTDHTMILRIYHTARKPS